MFKSVLASFSFLLLVGTTISQRSTLELSPVFYPEKNVVAIEDNDINFIGLSLYHFDDTPFKILYRFQFLDNSWSDWSELKLEEHGKGTNERQAYAANPIHQAIHAFQLKAASEVKQPTARIFISKSKSDQFYETTDRGFDCEQPDFCDRSCWCTDCPIDSSPEFTTPTHIIVHHSAGFNESPDFVEVVAYYYDLHVNTNGWDDIGYNWLIDPNGVIYEGRPDGYQGAHFSCINENTVGICVIGDFTSQLPTEEAMTTLVDLIGFEASAHKLDVTDETYHLTGDFILPTIAGHRDSSGSENACSGTSCPGDTFYSFLDVIRERVATLPCYCGDVSSNQDLHLDNIVVYPNPFAHSIHMEGIENEQYQLMNSQGQLILDLKVQSENDLSHLPKGLYFISSKGKILQSILKK